MTRISAGVVLALLITGCSSILGLSDRPKFQDKVPFEPPAAYTAYWDEAVACAGTEAIPGRTFQQIQWYSATSIKNDDNEIVSGYWEWFPAYSITIHVDWLEDRRVVIHELLHQLLSPRLTHGQGQFHRCDPFWYMYGPEPEPATR